MTHINQRRETSVNWAAVNPTLQLGEVGWESDTRKAKLGDGVTVWNDLPYAIYPGGAVTSVAGKTGIVTLTKTDVGLPLVNNTPDSEKPVSVATQEALNLKADLASPEFTGNPTAPTPALSDDDDSIATTGFVQDVISEAISSALTVDDGTIVLGDIRIAWGRKAAIDMDSSEVQTQAVVFPLPFGDVPTMVQVTVQGGGTDRIIGSIGSSVGQVPTATDFTIVLRTADEAPSTATPSVYWLAFGPA